MYKSSQSSYFPSNTSSWPNAGLMLGLRRRRLPSIKPKFGQLLVFGGTLHPRLPNPGFCRSAARRTVPASVAYDPVRCSTGMHHFKGRCRPAITSLVGEGGQCPRPHPIFTLLLVPGRWCYFDWKKGVVRKKRSVSMVKDQSWKDIKRRPTLSAVLFIFCLQSGSVAPTMGRCNRGNVAQPPKALWTKHYVTL